MRITYDEEKRLQVLDSRGFGFEHATEAFDHFHLTKRDNRNYNEDRLQTVREMNGQVVRMVWTLRDEDRRIITMWKLNHAERQSYYSYRDESG